MELSKTGGKPIYTAGVDIGSAACKCVLLQDGESILSRAVIPLGTGTAAPGSILQQALAPLQLTREDIAFLIVTGYGRMTFRGADRQISELSCHAKGVPFLLPGVRTVIDIGGQDIKALGLDEQGRLKSFLMNDKCAAGTGRFLEVMSRVLNVDIRDFAALSAQARGEVSISNTCTVFAESEVISRLAQNVSLPELIAGIHRSVAKRVASLAFRNGVQPPIALSGGVALNGGIVKALGEELKQTVRTHPDCQMAGALGAALFAFEEVNKLRITADEGCEQNG